LYEEFVYSGDGSFLSGTFADYLIATPTEAVDPVLVHTEQTPSPYTRLGAKGIGEGNQYTTPVCIANAVADALGRESIELPLVPSKVFEWIHAEEETPPPKQTVEQVKWDDSGTISSGGALQINADANSIWSVLVDPDRLARVFPGCRSLLLTSDNVYQGVVDLGVGPVSGTFDAFVELSNLDPPHTMTLTGKVIGPLGTSRGVGIIKMIDAGKSTKIEYSYQIGLSGTIASVGGRLISGAARVLINRFFAALVVEMNPDVSQNQKKHSWFSRFWSGRSRKP
jgi:2-furoyl-CoA dehydrogenase large subunit